MYEIGVREMVALCRVVYGGQLMRFRGGEGGFTDRFEAALCDKIGVKHALTVNSGTSALISALVGLGVGPGDEVIVPAYTWVATALAPLAVGAVPVLADIDESLTIDPADIKRKITGRTRAIIPVHMLNLPCDMDAIMKIASQRGLYVLEDACQAVGVRHNGRRLGSIGHAGAFSFNQFKNVSSGEGGAVLTNDNRVFTRATMYHDAGSYTREQNHEHNEAIFAGVNYRVSELTGAVLGEQFKRLDPILERLRVRRKDIAEILARGDGFTVSPHHDPDNAVSLTLLFDTAGEAKAFKVEHQVQRLIDTDRHVYTNWEPVMQKRSFHPQMNAFAWAAREIEYTPDTCARTLDILERTCLIPVSHRAPRSLIRWRVRGLLGDGKNFRHGLAEAKGKFRQALRSARNRPEQRRLVAIARHRIRPPLTVKPVKTGVIGCGNISSAYLKSFGLFDIVDVVACADIRLEVAQDCAKSFALPHACSPDELLADPNVELIVNLTPANEHYAVSAAALAAGKSVYSEKPLATDREHARSLREVAESRGLSFGCAPDTVLGGGLQTCRKLIDDGFIGTPIGASAVCTFAGPDTWHPDPAPFFQSGAGPLFDMGPYYITALVHLLGPIRRVTALAKTGIEGRVILRGPQAGDGIEVNTPTHVTTLLEFANGAHCSFMVSFDARALGEPFIEIYGSEGTLRVPDTNHFGGEVKFFQRKTNNWKDVALTHGYRDDCRGLGVADMALALRTGQPHRADARLAYHVVDVMQSILESAELGTSRDIESTCERPAPMAPGLALGDLGG